MKLKLLTLAMAAALAAGVAGTADASGKSYPKWGHGKGYGWGWGKPHKVPEIDLFGGLAAMATLGGAGALVLERRRRIRPEA